MSNVVNYVKVVVDHSSTALEAMRGTKHLRGSYWVLISIRKIQWKIIITWLRRRLLRWVKLLLNTRVVIRLYIVLVRVKEVVVVGVLRELVHHLIVVASCCIVVGLIGFLVQFFVLVTLRHTIVRTFLLRIISGRFLVCLLILIIVNLRLDCVLIFI